MAVGALQILARYGAVGLLFGFLQHFEQEKQAVILGVTLPEPRSFAFLALGVAAGGALLMLAAYFRYEVMRRALLIGKAYEVFCVRRLFSLTGHLPHPAAPRASRIVADGSIHKYQGYARRAGRLAWSIGQTVPAVFSLLLASVILLWLDYRLTAGLAVLTLLVLAAQYPANRRAAKSSQAMEDYAKGANRRVREILRVQQVSPVPVDVNASDHEALFHDDDYRRFMRGHTNRVLSMYQAGLASEIGGAVLLSGAILALGLGVLSGDLGFAHVIAYVGIIRFMLRDFVRVSKGFAVVNRFHAQLKIYREFVDEATTAFRRKRTSYDEQTGSLSLRCYHIDAAGESDALRISTGMPVAVLGPEAPGRTLPAALVDTLETASTIIDKPPFTVGTGVLLRQASLRFNLGLDPSEDAAGVAKELRAFGCETAAELVMSKGLDARFNKVFEPALSESDLLALNAIGAMQRGNRLLLIEAASLERQSDTWRRRFEELYAEVYLFVVHHAAGTIPAIDEDRVAIFDGLDLITWIEVPRTDEERQRLEDVYAKLVKHAKAITVGSLEDEEDLEEV